MCGYPLTAQQRECLRATHSRLEKRDPRLIRFQPHTNAERDGLVDITVTDREPSRAGNACGGSEVP